MAHLDDDNLEADDSVYNSIEDAAAAFPSDLSEDDILAEEEENSEDIPEQDEVDDDTDDVQDDDQDEGEEELEVPIDAPVSWGAEAKEAFNALPPKLQLQVVERESQREKFVNEKAQEAAEARKLAGQSQQNELQLQQVLAQQLNEISGRYAPVPPSQELAYSDPVEYNRQYAIYTAKSQEHEQFMQSIGGFNQEIENQIKQSENAAFQEDAQRVFKDLPELADIAAYNSLTEKLTPIALELGYSPDVIAEAMPRDVLAMKRAAAWKADSDKLKALQSKNMERVRSSKKSAKPNAAQPNGSGKAINRNAALKRLKQTGSMQDAAAALPEFR